MWDTRSLGGFLVQGAVHLEVHDRLAPFRPAGRRHPRHPAVLVALDPDHRVHNHPHLETVCVQLGGDRIHQEGGVLDVHVDHRPERLVPVGGHPRPVAANRQLAGRAAVHELEQTSYLGGQLGRGEALGQHRRRAPHVHAHELRQGTAARCVELLQQAVGKQRAVVVGLGDRAGLGRAAHKP